MPIALQITKYLQRASLRLRAYCQQAAKRQWQIFGSKRTQARRLEVSAHILRTKDCVRGGPATSTFDHDNVMTDEKVLVGWGKHCFNTIWLVCDSWVITQATSLAKTMFSPPSPHSSQFGCMATCKSHSLATICIAVTN